MITTTFFFRPSVLRLPPVALSQLQVQLFKMADPPPWVGSAGICAKKKKKKLKSIKLSGQPHNVISRFSYTSGDPRAGVITWGWPTDLIWNPGLNECAVLERTRVQNLLRKEGETRFPFKVCEEFEYKCESDFVVANVLLTWGGNNNNNNNNNDEASERLGTFRAREKIDLSLSEMRPWTQPERQLRREKQTCPNLFMDLSSPNSNIYPIILFFENKNKASVLVLTPFSWGSCLKMIWNDGSIPSSSQYHRRGFPVHYLLYVHSHVDGTPKQRRWQVLSWWRRDWTLRTHRSVSVTAEGHVSQDFTLVQPGPRCRWFNTKQTPSEPNNVWPAWGNCSRAVWRKETFSSRFTSPKQTSAAGDQQPVVSAVCWAAVSHLAVFAVFFFFPPFMEKCWCLFLPVPPKLRV